MEKETEPLSRFNTEEQKGTVRVDELLKQSSLPPVNVLREETPEIIEVHVSSRRSEKDEEERKNSGLGDDFKVSASTKFTIDTRQLSPSAKDRSSISPGLCTPVEPLSSEHALKALLEATGPAKGALL